MRSNRSSRSLGVVIVSCVCLLIGRHSSLPFSLLEQLVQPVEPLLDRPAVIGDPLLEIVETIAAKLALAHSTDLARV